MRKISNSPDITLDTDATVVVILLSYKRMQNIEPIVSSVLKCRFVKKIIVSNNNPEVDIHQWLTTDDSRIKIINQPARMPSGVRWHLADKEPSEYYIAIDDDLLIYPKQLKGLFECLIREPEIPHGLFGSNIQLPDPGNGKKLHLSYYKRKEMEVDTLHSIYAVSRSHVDNIFFYLSKLRENTEIRSDIFYNKECTLLSVGDDILTSFCGLGQPKIHDFGCLVFCKTGNDPGIAIHQRENFWDCRLKITKAIKVFQVSEMAQVD